MGQFEKWLQDNLIIVAGIFVGIALLQVSQSRLLCRYSAHFDCNGFIHVSEMVLTVMFMMSARLRRSSKCLQVVRAVASVASAVRVCYSQECLFQCLSIHSASLSHFMADN